ncbi:MAG TPA: DoxX family protein [Planctomycetota bacterium]|nr:DoxX family protein [Planctomycetota bacterium]
MDARETGWMTSLGLLVLRVGIGGLMAMHGIGKLLLLTGGTAANFGSWLGMPPTLALSLSVFAELICAVAIVLGLATRLCAAIVAFNMGVAVFVAHASAPLMMDAGYQAWAADHNVYPASKEPALLFLIPFVALVLTGAGRLSLDAVIWPWWKRRRAAKVLAEA